jgi:hypothetical protein
LRHVVQISSNIGPSHSVSVTQLRKRRMSIHIHRPSYVYTYLYVPTSVWFDLMKISYSVRSNFKGLFFFEKDESLGYKFYIVFMKIWIHIFWYYFIKLLLKLLNHFYLWMSWMSISRKENYGSWSWIVDSSLINQPHTYVSTPFYTEELNNPWSYTVSSFLQIKSNILCAQHFLVKQYMTHWQDMYERYINLRSGLDRGFCHNCAPHKKGIYILTSAAHKLINYRMFLRFVNLCL